jgi:hypothetical protein
MDDGDDFIEQFKKGPFHVSSTTMKRSMIVGPVSTQLISEINGCRMTSYPQTHLGQERCNQEESGSLMLWN